MEGRGNTETSSNPGRSTDLAQLKDAAEINENVAKFINKGDAPSGYLADDKTAERFWREILRHFRIEEYPTYRFGLTPRESLCDRENVTRSHEMDLLCDIYFSGDSSEDPNVPIYNFMWINSDSWSQRSAGHDGEDVY